MPNPIVLSLPALIALSVKIGLLIYAQRSPVRNRHTQLFAWLLIALGLHNISEILVFLFARNGGIPYGPLYFYFVAAIPAIALFVHLFGSLGTPLNTSRYRREILFALYAYAGLLEWLLLFTPWLITDFEPLGWSFYRVPGPLYGMFEFYAVGGFISAWLFLLYGSIAPVSRERRLRCQLMLFGITPTIALVVANIVLMHFAINVLNTPMLVPIAITFFLIVTAYAMHQTRVLDRTTSRLYRRIGNMIAEISGLGGMEEALRRLNQTLRRPVTLFLGEQPLLAPANMSAIDILPGTALHDLHEIVIAAEAADLRPDLYRLMRHHHVAAIVPFTQRSHSPAGWLLLGEATSDSAHITRSTISVEELFDQMVALFIDRLFVLRAQLTAAEARIAKLEQRYTDARARIHRLESESHAVELKAHGLPSPLAQTPAVTILGCDKALVREVRLHIPDTESYAEPRLLERRSGNSDVIVCCIGDGRTTRFSRVIGHMSTSAIALTGANIAPFVMQHLPQLRGGLVELLPSDLAPALMSHRILALGKLRRACHFSDPQTEPLVGISAAFVAAIEQAKRLATEARRVAIVSRDRGQALAFAHAIHHWSHRTGRVLVNGAPQLDSDQDTRLIVGFVTQVATPAAVVHIGVDAGAGLNDAAIVSLPLLPQRSHDIALLVHYFTLQFNLLSGLNVHLSEATADTIAAGVATVDELKKRVFAQLQAGSVGTSDLPSLPADPMKTLDDHVAEFEARIIRETLARCGGNKAKAARMLGLRPNTLHYKLERYGLNEK